MTFDTLETNAAEETVQTIDKEAQPIYIMDGCVKVTINGADKFISLDSFMEILDRAASAERDARMEDMFLPSNVFYFGRNGSRINMNMYYVGGVRNVSYYSSNRPSVIPNIILSVTLDRKGADYVVVETRYFCTDLPVSRLPRKFINSIAHSERIFLLPFSNTYDSGRMCYGGNTMPSRFTGGNFRGLDWYYQYMFESPFNDDLGVKAVGDSPKSWYDRLASCAKKGEPFPYEKLRGYTPLTPPSA